MILKKFKLTGDSTNKTSYKVERDNPKTATVSEPKPEIKREATPTPMPKAKIKGASSNVLKQRKGRISIKDFANNKAKDVEETELELSTGNATEYFSLDILQKAWVSFSYEIEKTGKTMAAHTLRDNKLELGSDHKIIFPLHSQSQVNIFNGVKIELTNVLRSKLNNYKINIETPIVSGGEVQKKFMNAEERFKKLCEEKPQLMNLKKIFGLDFE